MPRIITPFTPYHGWIEVVAGCMYSGKSEELIRRLRRAAIAKQNVVAFKPKVDDRYHPTNIATHLGVTITARSVEVPDEIYDRSKEADVVGIDEAQFFDHSLVEVVDLMATLGKRIVIAGLDLDFRGMPFGSMPHLLALADDVIKLNAVCVTCGGPATHTFRTTPNQQLVAVGSTNSYEARCRFHWLEGFKSEGVGDANL